MTRYDILNEALAESANGTLPQENLEQYTNAYEVYLGDLLEERNWLFAYEITSNLSETEDGSDLGYRYKYRLPADATGIVGDTDNKVPRFLSTEEAHRAGYSVLPEELAERRVQRAGIFVDGIYHTNSRLTSLLYKRTVTPDVMPKSFQKLLIYSLAERFAISTSRDESLANRLRTKKREQHNRALREYVNAPSDPYLQSIYRWLIEFETSTSALRWTRG